MAGVPPFFPRKSGKFYERNPRSHHEMEAYNALKSSIKEIGIKQPVYVTQRPNSENCSGLINKDTQFG